MSEIKILVYPEMREVSVDQLNEIGRQRVSETEKKGQSGVLYIPVDWVLSGGAS